MFGWFPVEVMIIKDMTVDGVAFEYIYVKFILD